MAAMNECDKTVPALNDIMEFDHVIIVGSDGSIRDAPDRREFWAPEFDTETETVSDGWELMDGYSGQYRYAGPIMHPSEYIGGVMERDIRATPGVYVALTAEDPNPDNPPHGWVVARMYLCERCHAEPITDKVCGLGAECTANNDGRVVL